MSDTRNLQDNTELMRLQAKEFKLAGISHLGIEDEWHQSPLFLEFVGTSSRYVKDILEIPDNVRLDLSVFQPDSLTGSSSTMNISRQVREIKYHAKGILLKIFLPEIKAAENGSMNVSYAKPRTAFIYGNTYEEAIYKAGVFADCYVDLSLACDRLMFEDGTLLSSKLQPSSIGREVVKSIRKMLPY
ncbi:MAG: hypothetical protein CL840_15070 [Crocinitomicaceae bacterium]|nr:hypothetical protein [Crocinitomicaceae bacterium]|tara:strand:+ start:128616 stop:129176 length:561 start_codon:yes stop_codon:yes gene_type:complete